MKNRRLVSLTAATVLISCGVTILVLLGIQRFESGSDSIARSQAAVAPDFGKLPISFEANRGQTEPRVDFVAQGHGFQLFLSANEAALMMRTRPSHDGQARVAGLRMKLKGALPVDRSEGLEELTGKKITWSGMIPRSGGRTFRFSPR